jgi:hypothetical protein
MLKTMLARVTLVCIMLVATGSLASADLIFTVSGNLDSYIGITTLDGTLSGSFTTDNTAQVLKSADLSVTAGVSYGTNTPIPAFEFKYGTGSGDNSSSTSPLPSYIYLHDGSSVLLLAFSPGFTTSGGTIDTNSSYVSQGGYNRYFISGTAGAQAGTLTVAPEPSTLLTLATGVPIGALVWLRRRRSRAVPRPA